MYLKKQTLEKRQKKSMKNFVENILQSDYSSMEYLQTLLNFMLNFLLKSRKIMLLFNCVIDKITVEPNFI